MTFEAIQPGLRGEVKLIVARNTPPNTWAAAQ
jgi:hypothetical protein